MLKSSCGVSTIQLHAAAFDTSDGELLRRDHDFLEGIASSARHLPARLRPGTLLRV